MTAANEPDVRTKILLAAKTLFAKQGFEGTTVRQVCDAAGANVALVSYHFGGKDNLFKALFDEFFPAEEAMEPFREAFERPARGVATLIEQVMLYVFRDPDLSTIMEQEIMMRSPRISIIQARAFPIWSALRDMLQRGREEGVFRFRCLDTTLLMVLGSMMFHKRAYYFQPLFLEGPQRSEDVIADTIRYVYGALGAVAPGEGGAPT
ncbi:TetR/AcrR family transcriptional regulator [Paenibacillus antri]|uniref:TetR/AcrR family transcriptional regulator n=1 Tax=Paenibacillus antri TaxID=2582848 RepID=A0A5R9G497_9BACL|nr:TetR family transcriptional regulator [Paenibacillus antri]TLS49156.1 TetR/AcrR family transcriptional regulator [Paenibacillus antri]